VTRGVRYGRQGHVLTLFEAYTLTLKTQRRGPHALLLLKMHRRGGARPAIEVLGAARKRAAAGRARPRRVGPRGG